MIKKLVLFFALGLTGCVTQPQTVVQTEIVKVAVPVSCVVEVPERPNMPTDAKYLLELPADMLADPLMQALLAEVEVREGYEGRLLTALKSCIRETEK